MLEAVKRKSRKYRVREGKRYYGISISERFVIVVAGTETGHWEGDIVVGRRSGKKAVILTLLEKLTNNYISIHVLWKTSRNVINAIVNLWEEFGPLFSDIFKTITVDNGSEFADFFQAEQYGTKVYFAHLYTSWERAQNECHNSLFRAFVPKGAFLETYTDEDILIALDLLNS